MITLWWLFECGGNSQYDHSRRKVLLPSNIFQNIYFLICHTPMTGPTSAMLYRCPVLLGFFFFFTLLLYTSASSAIQHHSTELYRCGSWRKPTAFWGGLHATITDYGVLCAQGGLYAVFSASTSSRYLCLFATFFFFPSLAFPDLGLLPRLAQRTRLQWL